MLGLGLMLGAMLMDLDDTKVPIKEFQKYEYQQESMNDSFSSVMVSLEKEEKYEVQLGELALDEKQIEQAKQEALEIMGKSTRHSLVDIAKEKIGKTRYVFGGGREYSHSYLNIFDCSSFVHYVYRLAGMELGDITSVSTETLNKIGNRISIEDVQIGDLIFFDTYKKDGHVGIWIGDGKWIGSQSSSGVSIESINNPYWQARFNGHVRDIISS